MIVVLNRVRRRCDEPFAPDQEAPCLLPGLEHRQNTHHSDTKSMMDEIDAHANASSCAHSLAGVDIHSHEGTELTDQNLVRPRALRAVAGRENSNTPEYSSELDQDIFRLSELDQEQTEAPQTVSSADTRDVSLRRNRLDSVFGEINHSSQRILRLTGQDFDPLDLDFAPAASEVSINSGSSSPADVQSLEPSMVESSSLWGGSCVDSEADFRQRPPRGQFQELRKMVCRRPLACSVPLIVQDR